MGQRELIKQGGVLGGSVLTGSDVCMQVSEQTAVEGYVSILFF